MQAADYKTEDIGGEIKICVSAEHTFGADAVLLSHFASPKKSDTACDICSGCGIIPLLWFGRGNAPNKAYAVDIQETVYAQMLRSAEISGLSDSFIPILADLRGDMGLPPGQFDVITCNPPYRAQGSGKQSQSDSARTARHETLCTISDVCEAAKRLLRFGGKLCVCHLPERLPDLFAAMREHNIEPKRLRLVHKDAAAAPWLALIEGRLGGKPSLKVEQPLFMTEGGSISGEMQAIYEMNR